MAQTHPSTHPPAEDYTGISECVAVGGWPPPPLPQIPSRPAPGWCHSGGRTASIRNCPSLVFHPRVRGWKTAAQCRALPYVQRLVISVLRPGGGGARWDLVQKMCKKDGRKWVGRVCQSKFWVKILIFITGRFWGVFAVLQRAPRFNPHSHPVPATGHHWGGGGQVFPMGGSWLLDKGFFRSIIYCHELAKPPKTGGCWTWGGGGGLSDTLIERQLSPPTETHPRGPASSTRGLGAQGAMLTQSTAPQPPSPMAQPPNCEAYNT